MYPADIFSGSFDLFLQLKYIVVKFLFHILNFYLMYFSYTIIDGYFADCTGTESSCDMEASHAVCSFRATAD